MKSFSSVQTGWGIPISATKSDGSAGIWILLFIVSVMILGSGIVTACNEMWDTFGADGVVTANHLGHGGKDPEEVVTVQITAPERARGEVNVVARGWIPQAGTPVLLRVKNDDHGEVYLNDDSGVWHYFLIGLFASIVTGIGVLVTGSSSIPDQRKKKQSKKSRKPVVEKPYWE